MRASFKTAPSTKVDTSKVPAVLPSQIEQDNAEPQLFDHELLQYLLPGYFSPHQGAEPTEQIDSPFQVLPGKDWIRLLILEPQIKPGFQYYLRPVQLHTALGKYEALSYCWKDADEGASGDIDELKETMCNGFPVILKRNLRMALTNLRYQAIPRILWVDALCINQEDDRERANQVQLMGDIYRHASRTIIWLGNIKQEESVLAFDAACRLVNDWSSTCSASYHARDGEDLRRLPSNDERYEFNAFDFVPLFKSKWFERRWVIQEAALAHNAIVVVPGANIAWKWIALAAAILRTNYLKILTEIGIHTNVCNAYLMARLSGKMALPPLKVNLLYLLRLTTGFKTSELLDTVFALLGLTSNGKQDDTQPFMVVDYSWTYEELMRRLAKELMKLSEPLAFLSDAVGAWRGSANNSPSWLPDYGKKSYTMLDPWALDGSAFSPARGLSPQKGPLINDSQLIVDGICFSRVVWKTACLSDSQQIDNMMEQVFLLMQHFKPNVDDFEKLTIISQTMTGGRDSYGNRNKARSDYAKDFADFLSEWRRYFNFEPGSSSFNKVDELARGGQYTRFMEVAPTVYGRWSLFLTMSGHIGLAPEAVEVGDVIFVLGGAPMLHVLSCVNDEYKLIGDCFIDRLMDGEIVDSMNSKSRPSGPVNVISFLESMKEWLNGQAERKSIKCSFTELPELALGEISLIPDTMEESLSVCRITIV
jgi:hypothetical protein